MCMRLCAYLSAHPKDAVCTDVCVCADSAAKLHFTDPVNDKYNSQTASLMLLARSVSSQSFSGDMQLNAS